MLLIVKSKQHPIFSNTILRLPLRQKLVLAKEPWLVNLWIKIAIFGLNLPI